MCRIAGLFDPQASNLEGDILCMRDAMHRGGPDGSGVYIHPEMKLALGHRRLALQDLSGAGHQPMQSADGRLTIIYNGEIYNFNELRSELEAAGHCFRSKTDTEVILASYLQWGKQCFRRFNGMFALAIWDNVENEIVLARDHAGIKPLYFHLSSHKLVFSSEIRGFTALYPTWKTAEIWKPLFLLFGHLPEPFTTLDGVQTLAKGGWLAVHLPSLNSTHGNFFKLDYSSTINTEDRALEAARDILPAAVKRHLISDAPIGLFLSGGIDSSLLTLLAAPIMKERLTTLSIQFSEAEFSEEKYQKMVIDITCARHSAFQVSQQDFEDSFPDILMAMDQPSTDAINSYFISKFAHQCGLKAVLSGLGADEIFGGYPSFNRFNQWKYIAYIPDFISKLAGRSSNMKLAKLSYECLHPMLSMYLMNRGLYTVETASDLTGISIQRIEDALALVDVPANMDYTSKNSNAAMETDLYMKNQLLKDADYMSMWHGLEIRVPFLDKELLQAITSISPHIKFRRSLPKALLIEAFSTLLPAEIWHRKKQGFTFPFASWLKTAEILRPSDAREQKIFDRFEIGKLHWSRYWAVKVAGLEKFA